MPSDDGSNWRKRAAYFWCTSPSLLEQDFLLRPAVWRTEASFFFFANYFNNPWNSLSYIMSCSSLSYFKRTPKQIDLSNFLTRNQ